MTSPTGFVPRSPARAASGISGLVPWRATPGGVFRVIGGPFTIGNTLPMVEVGGVPVRPLFASSTSLTVRVPPDAVGGTTAVKVEGLAGETAFLDVGRELVTGIHAVDSPLIDGDGSVFVTCSGSRGQRTPVSIYRVLPTGVRDVFATDIVNATSLAVDPRGALHVTSRFDGTVLQLARDGTSTVVATDLGIACGLAFDRDGTMYVGDRSGTLFRKRPDEEAEVLATLPASIAAYHVAVGPDGDVFVAVPTLTSRNAVFRITPEGEVSVVTSAFGRPQGLAFDASGDLYVAEALAGASGLYRVSLDPDVPPQLVVAGDGVIGVAFDQHGGFVVVSNDTAWRFLGAATPTVTM